MVANYAEVQSVLAATKDESEAVRSKALDALIGEPSQTAADGLWKSLVTGLLILLAIALAGMLWAILDGETDTSPDVAVTAFTALLTGLLGLFIKSPTQK